MSRRGDYWDNAPAKSFFDTFRAELVDHERCETRDAALISMATTSGTSTTRLGSIR
jgi:transposase InsO family protein